MNVGMNEKGNQVFKLDVLTQLNEINHNAHDAMGDVEATIEIAKILKNKAQNVWESGLSNSNKIEVDNFLLKNNIICMDEFFFGKFNSYVVSYICKNKFNYPQCFDLIHDPIDYFDLSIKDLKAKMKLRPKLIREIKNNKNPVLLSQNYVEKITAYKLIGLDTLKERAEQIKNNSDFKNKIQTVLIEENEEKLMFKSQDDVEPEDSLYIGGFPDNSDKSKMLQFQKADWEEKFFISNQFKDQRYQYFAHRLIYEEAPQILPAVDYEKVHKIIAKQILSTDNEKWNTIPKSYHQLDTLRDQYENEKNDEKLKFLGELDGFLQNLEKKYQ
jgi:exodeoxyribonuclease-1